MKKRHLFKCAIKYVDLLSKFNMICDLLTAFKLLLLIKSMLISCGFTRMQVSLSQLQFYYKLQVNGIPNSFYKGATEYVCKIVNGRFK